MLEPKSDDQRNDLIRLTELWRSRIDEAQRERGNTPLSRPEKQQILDNILLDRVYQSDTVMLVPAGSTFTRMFELGADELDNTYVVVADNGRSEQLLVANIPADQTTLITDAFRRSSNSGAQLDTNGNVVRLGRYPTTQEIAQIWVSGGRRR